MVTHRGTFTNKSSNPFADQELYTLCGIHLETRQGIRYAFSATVTTCAKCARYAAALDALTISRSNDTDIRISGKED